jgi:hypothetical protein
MSDSTILDPNTFNLVLSGQSALGSGSGMPKEGVLKITVTEANIRQNSRGVSLWLTLTTDSGYKLYDYVALPTAQNAQEKTKYGTKAEFFEKKLKATLCAFGHSVDGIKALTGNAYTGQHLIDWTLNREGNVYYRPPVGSGKHQIDYVANDKVELVRSGEVVFQDRRMGAGATVQPTVAMPSMATPTMAPTMAMPSNNGVASTPQPIASNVIDGLIGGNL